VQVLIRKQLELLPALDVQGGKSVRISFNNVASQTPDSDPKEIADKFLEMGAKWLHLVDLDAAYGVGNNRELLSKLIGGLSIKVQFSGGIKDEDSLKFAMESRCVRANIATAALSDMDWVARAISNYGERIVIGLDIRGRDLFGRGSKVLIKDFASSIRTLNSLGAPRYVVTDVEKDGSLSGPSLDLLDEVLQLTERPVVWSGGVSTLEQLELLRARTSTGLEGVIIGKAFYEGELSFPEALGVCST